VETLVVLGNLGLVLLIVQAGLEMDYATLKLVGLRGVIIAICGTILPVAIGTSIASVYLDDWRSALAAGCSFGPTSAGIAMNVLGQCKVAPAVASPAGTEPDEILRNDKNEGSKSKDTPEGNILQLPVGQLIVAAAIVDDILALVVLSQLQALTTTAVSEDDESGDGSASNMAVDMAIPIVSAILWLVAGGAIALFAFPKGLEWVLDRLSSQRPGVRETNADGSLSLMVLLGLLFGLLPATYYSKASYLLGAFLSGLAFCRDSSGVDAAFAQQFQRPLDYLMKLFFAASIGFQVPVRSFGDGAVLARGCLFALALTGKLAVGLLAPNLYRADTNDNDKPTGRFRGRHLRDCFVVGFSMMGEAEFAFVVAVFGVSEGLVPPDVYASIVWAILVSTVISPLLLKTTLAFFPYEAPSVQEPGASEE
jgi:Kef-type K+ transport system membrane component KefB